MSRRWGVRGRGVKRRRVKGGRGYYSYGGGRSGQLRGQGRNVRFAQGMRIESKFVGVLLRWLLFLRSIFLALVYGRGKWMQC